MQDRVKKRRPIAESPVRFVAPCLVAVAAVLFSLLLVFPILKMSPRNIPVAICSLDEGVNVSGEEVVVGDKFVDSLTGDDDEEGDKENIDNEGEENESSSGISVGEDAVAWTVFDSADEMRGAVERGDFYAAITIPADFSERLVAVKGREALGEQLVSKLAGLADGSDALTQGLGTVGGGADALSDGTSSLAQGAGKLGSSAQALPQGVQKLSEGSSALSEGLLKAQDGSDKLQQGLEAAAGASGGVKELIEAANQALESGEYETAGALLLKASQASAGTQQALEGLSGGAASLADGIEAAAQGAQALDNGVSALGEGSNALAQGARSLSKGADAVDNGVGSLSGGIEKLESGASKLSKGIGKANDALEELPSLQEDGGGKEDAASALDGQLSLDSDEEDPNAPRIEILINPVKNPMVTNSLTSAFNSFETQGIVVDQESLHEIPSELNTGFAHMPLLIMTYLGSYIAAAVVSMLLKPKRTSRARMAQGLCAQVACAAAAAVVIGFLSAGAFITVLGVDIDGVQLGIFLTLCSFSLQLIVVASLDLFGTPGMAVPLLLMALCMLSAYFPYEFMPSFWQEYIYPWNPLRYMVDGFKQILYAGATALNAATNTVGIVALVGAIALLLNLVKKPRQEAEGEGAA